MFEGSSLSKGMSWSSVVGGVGAGLLGPLGAVFGGLAGGFLSDSWEAKKLKAFGQQVTDALNKVLEAFHSCRPQVWNAFMDCAYCTVEVRDAIETSHA